ncbi:histidine phosphatase family protein [Pseudomonas sp. PB103]|nr:histidine phosphatase family protein [Pseudomonas sp. PB103]
MKHVRLIRHGESAANAGEPSLDHASIPLTLKGVEQARQVAGSFVQAPDLIVASPFSRAQATAMQTVAAFPSVSFEIWPIHEFTYLEPARCINTTVAQRRDWVDSYWAKADFTFIDGEGAESFLDFISRAQSFLNRVTEHPAQDIAVFSHGQLINAVAWLIERNPQEIDGRAMADWREYEIANHVPNCEGCLLSKKPEEAAWRVNRPSRLTADAASALSAREVCQVLREVIFGRCGMTKVGQASWDEIYAGHLHIDVDGWRISIYNDCDTLDYCEECFSADGRRWSFDSGDRFGTDQVALLSTWEHQTLEQMLKEL